MLEVHQGSLARLVNHNCSYRNTLFPRKVKEKAKLGFQFELTLHGNLHGHDSSSLVDTGKS